MSEKSEATIFSRHTKRADGSMGYGPESHERPSESYPNITIEGEEKAREVANSEFFEVVENSSQDSVLFIGGSSEEERTKATAEVVGDELAEKFKDNEDVIVFTNAKDKDVVQSTLSQFSGAELSSETIECLGGVKIKSKDGTMTFDNTLDAKIERLKPLIRKDIATQFGVSN